MNKSYTTLCGFLKFTNTASSSDFADVSPNLISYLFTKLLTPIKQGRQKDLEQNIAEAE